jgi:transketolase
MNPSAFDAIGLSVRLLTVDAIEKANSGHPGLPLGCAELGGLIFGEVLSHFPQDPLWANRDRFILSAGHGSMLLYALLHLSGYDLGLEDLKRFRTLRSKTPGHPEYGAAPGIETTTGPLGQGFGNAVGIAIAERMLAAQFNTTTRSVIDHYTYVLAGDGDMMEGVVYEAASLAGHLGLGKLIVFYDDNQISIDGATNLTFSEDVMARFAACNWQTFACSAYDLEELRGCVRKAKADLTRPTLIKVRSVMGKGSPSFAGTHRIHSGALGTDELRKMKQAMGVSPDRQFYIAEEAIEFFRTRNKEWKAAYDAWCTEFALWTAENPDRLAKWQEVFGVHRPPYDLAGMNLPGYSPGDMVATRTAGGKVVSTLLDRCDEIVGGSADLTMPCLHGMTYSDNFAPTNPKGRLIYFGVREHAMGAIANGLALHGMRPFCSTFLTFSDYLRPSLRLSALMRLPVIYVLAYDSIWNGEDGPTHEPVEHLAALRAMPNLLVLRPGDAEETEAVWEIALNRRQGPTALSLTRQAVPVYAKWDPDWRKTITRGAYIVKQAAQSPRLVIVATGSEVSSALRAVERSSFADRIRIISMVSRELFLQQEEAFRAKLLGEGAELLIVEAGVAQGWETICGKPRARIVSVERFGESAPGEQVAEHLGVGPTSLLREIEGIFSALER